LEVFTMQRSLFGLGLVVSFAALVGCSASSESASAYPGAPASGGGDSPGAAGMVAPPSGGGAQGTSAPSSQSELTVGLWDDNRNFAHFERYLTSTPAHTNLFDFQELKAKSTEHQAAPGPKGALDVTFLIDTTGSMGDELSYLKRELVAIQARVASQVSDARYGVVTYRDHGDDYVTRRTELDAKPETARNAILREGAMGGGDMPEAVAEGLTASVNLSWRQDPNVAKVIFWIADAEEQHGTTRTVAAAIRAARAKGIHVYPIAASGVSAQAELTMRVAAQYTGGRYLFLTDDSGIGDSHAEPFVPCYVVQKLDAAILRVLRIETSGAYEAAKADEIVRTAGTVDAQGRCTVKPMSTIGVASPAEAWVF